MGERDLIKIGADINFNFIGFLCNMTIPNAPTASAGEPSGTHNPSRRGIFPSIHEIARQRLEKLKKSEGHLKEHRTRSEGSSSAPTVKKNIMTLQDFTMGRPVHIIDGGTYWRLKIGDS